MEPELPPQRTPPPSGAMTGRVPLAVAVVDADGLVSHWSTGARRLFGVTRHEAVGCPAGELLPIPGVLGRVEKEGGSGGGPGPDCGLGSEPDGPPGGNLSYPAAGRARIDEPARGRIDVLWWAYPLVGPGAERLLVLAADAGRTSTSQSGNSPWIHAKWRGRDAWCAGSCSTGSCRTRWSRPS